MLGESKLSDPLLSQKLRQKFFPDKPQHVVPGKPLQYPQEDFVLIEGPLLFPQPQQYLQEPITLDIIVPGDGFKNLFLFSSSHHY
ncbi:MAG: hypothetical protein COX16_10795 [Deltaproteobacteria bacterium CG23_combo_of_CG06-09_8_20_14_all_51_20]|nr:MAG: hypothetical protein COX16_10795 [Deltaproteobacteria bacterium CG23_combo_of_CG06-09_8_20_14_all_51_20]